MMPWVLNPCSSAEQPAAAPPAATLDESREREFRRHVVPVLSKQGCNSGACHGALAGKGGFKLSLRGYDPAGDYYAITQHGKGRRISLADPASSLLLAKPSGAVPHKGGLRLDASSPEYQVIASWITQGIAGPSSQDPKLERIEVLPDKVSLGQDEQQQLSVRAYYSDGQVEDVTRWAKYSSSNETVAAVSEEGKIQVMGAGEGAVVVWFSSQIVLSRVTVPYSHERVEASETQWPVANFIDERVNQKLVQLNLQPSPRADDLTFLRRVYLDTIGTLPTEQEIDEFLEDPASCKREHVVDALLNREEFVDYWTYRWSDILLINGKRLRPQAVQAYYQWLHGHVDKNSPWDLIVREIITATGSSYENGATNFYALHQTPEEMAENASQAFLGLSINCAKCHNHPLEKWTNDQYYGMANLFARVRAKGWGGDGRSGDGLRTLYLARSGELVQPLRGVPQPPRPLDGEPLDFDDTQDRREALADWMTSPKNPYFSRSITNRVWQNFMGVGLVEQVDDLRVSNPPTNPELLDELAQYLVQHNYDLKALMRVILLSEAYQRSSEAVPANVEDTRFYSRYYPKRLMAEVLLDAIAQVTGVPTDFSKIQYDGADIQDTKEYPRGTRAIALYDSAVQSKFLSTFGRNKRDIVCECERSNKPSMVQVLHMNNGSTINDRLKSEESCVAKSLDRNDWDQVIQSAYRATLCRLPTDGELTQIKQILEESQGEERRVALEDFYWSLLTSREFVFNH
jgi:hypothetical protein